MSICTKRFIIFGALALICIAGAFFAGRLYSRKQGAAPENFARSAETNELPSPEQLKRLASTALRKAGAEQRHAGPVKLERKLSDDSYIVSITLENGRSVSGRLFRDRRRYKISIDERDLFSDEIIIKTQTY